MTFHLIILSKILDNNFYFYFFGWIRSIYIFIFPRKDWPSLGLFVYSTLNVTLKKEKKEQSQAALLDHPFRSLVVGLCPPSLDLHRWIFIVGFYMVVIEVVALLVTQALEKWVGRLWGEMSGSGKNEPRQRSWLVFCDASPSLDGVVGVPMLCRRFYAGVGLSSC